MTARPLAFDDAADERLLQIRNPPRHGGELHLEAFDLVHIRHSDFNLFPPLRDPQLEIVALAFELVDLAADLQRHHLALREFLRRCGVRPPSPDVPVAVVRVSTNRTNVVLGANAAAG